MVWNAINISHWPTTGSSASLLIIVCLFLEIMNEAAAAAAIDRLIESGDFKLDNLVRCSPARSSRPDCLSLISCRFFSPVFIDSSSYEPNQPQECELFLHWKASSQRQALAHDKKGPVPPPPPPPPLLELRTELAAHRCNLWTCCTLSD